MHQLLPCGHCPAIAEVELQTPLTVWDNNLNPNPRPLQNNIHQHDYFVFRCATRNQCSAAQ